MLTNPALAYLVFGGNSKNTVDIDFESDFDLRNTASGWRNAGQIELAENVVVLGHWSFAFVHL